MRFLKKITSIPFLLALACSERPTGGNSAEFYGVFCVLDPRLNNQVVTVSRIFNTDVYDEYSEDVQKTEVSGAIVTIRTETDTFLLRELAPGFYESDSNLKITSSKAYFLDVSKGGVRLSATTVVPPIPSLLPGFEPDTLRIRYVVDTTYVSGGYYVEYRIVGDPTPFRWEGGDGLSYFFELGDTVTDDASDRFMHTILQSKLRLTPSIEILDDRNTGEWMWVNQNFSHDTISTKVNVSAFDRCYTNVKFGLGSNIKNGFGFFGSMSLYQRPITILIDMENE